MDDLLTDISACQLCLTRFARTASHHRPRPVVQADPRARLLIAGQAPGARVHRSGMPFQDRSGDRLRDWTGISESVFYDPSTVAIVPMAFCFPGYNSRGVDLPPPSVCPKTWRMPLLQQLPRVRLTLLFGGFAQKWHLGVRDGVGDVVANWRAQAPQIFALPHPSWRNTAWIKKNPWFEAELLPALRQRVREVLND